MVFLVFLGSAPRKVGTLEQYPKIRDFPQQNQYPRKVTTLQNFSEQYDTIQNTTHDIEIQKTTKKYIDMTTKEYVRIQSQYYNAIQLITN